MSRLPNAVDIADRRNSSAVAMDGDPGEEGCTSNAITARSTVAEVLRRHPRCAIVFRHLGLNCCVCANSDVDTVGAIARALDFPLSDLLRDLHTAARLFVSNTASTTRAVPRSEEGA